MFTGMSTELVFALLLGVTMSWIMLPFIPALVELLAPRDAAPLIAVGNDAGQLTFFAQSFTQRMVDEGLLGETLPTQLRDGSAIRLHGASAPLTASRSAVQDVVVLVDDTALPDGLQLATECLARSSFFGGANGNYRAVLGLANVHLGAGTTVQRWVHASGGLTAATGARLIGRATADREIRLDASVQFDRLDAPVVRVGSRDTAETQILPSSAYSPFTPEKALALGANYWRVTGDLTVPAGTSVSGSMIVLGDLRVSDGACIEGAIKARGTVHVGRGAVLKGAVAARGRITIEDDARLVGPVISETEIVLGAAVVGRAGHRTTITAPRVQLGDGATVYGAVMSANGGMSATSVRDAD